MYYLYLANKINAHCLSLCDSKNCLLIYFLPLPVYSLKKLTTKTKIMHFRISLNNKKMYTKMDLLFCVVGN